MVILFTDVTNKGAGELGFSRPKEYNYVKHDCRARTSCLSSMPYKNLSLPCPKNVILQKKCCSGQKQNRSYPAPHSEISGAFGSFGDLRIKNLFNDFDSKGTHASGRQNRTILIHYTKPVAEWLISFYALINASLLIELIEIKKQQRCTQVITVAPFLIYPVRLLKALPPYAPPPIGLPIIFS